MISIIITTYQESRTLPKAIQAILDSIRNSEKVVISGKTLREAQMFEILIIGPDQKTKEIAKEFSKKYPSVKYLKDKGRGKPAALNLGFKIAKGKILVLTDGDVWIEQKSLKALLEPFQSDKVGAVTGQPVSINKRDNLFGYWSHFLTNAAHQWRLKGGNFPCSGYLYSFRDIIKKIPENALAEDGIITQMTRDKDYQVTYAPEAKVYVKYPDNFKDWLKQKVRSTGGYTQSQSRGDRNFRQEIKNGLILFFTYPKTIKEFFWTGLLYLARLYLWLKIFWQIKIKKKSFSDVWQRIESTK